MTQHRDTRILQFQPRPAAPAVEGSAAAERVRPAKNFAGSLDALARALVSPDAANSTSMISAMASRACEAGRAIAGQVLHVEASGITLEGDGVLACAPDTGRWILPAWYAGLRGLTTTVDLREEDVRILAAGLCNAAPGLEAVDRLASWLWSSPVDGIHLEMRTCAVERIEAVSGAPDAARAALRSAWLETAGTLLQGNNPFASQTETTSARERAWWERLQSGDLVLSREERHALRADADDAGAVLRLELMTAMAQDAWQSALPAPLVARAITRLVARSYDRDLNSLSGLLAGDEGDYGRVCVAELANCPVGETLAAATPLQANMPEEALFALQAVLNNQSEQTSSALIRGLLERAAQDPEALIPVLARLLVQLGATVFLRYARPANLTGPVRLLLGRILLAAAPSAEELAAVCETLPTETFVELLRATPTAELGPLLPALASALTAAAPRERTAIVLYLTDSTRVAELPEAAVAAVAQAFIGTGGAGWELRTVRLVAELALRNGVAADELLALQRSAKVSPDVRVSVLEALARSPEYAAEALKWRMGEMFDAPELRDRLVELRKQRLP